MVAEGERVAIFHSIHKVMKAETCLKLKRAAILLIPAPRELGSDCGLAIRYAGADAAEVEAILAEAGLLPKEVFRREKSGFVSVATG